MTLVVKGWSQRKYIKNQNKTKQNRAAIAGEIAPFIVPAGTIASIIASYIPKIIALSIHGYIY